MQQADYRFLPVFPATTD